MKNIFNIFKVYFFVKDNISYLFIVLNKCFDCNKNSNNKNNKNNNINNINNIINNYNNININLKHKQSNDFLSENNLKIISNNNCYICNKNLINNNNELEQENVTLINPHIYLAYDKIFCSPGCRSYFLDNI